MIINAEKGEHSGSKNDKRITSIGHFQKIEN